MSITLTNLNQFTAALRAVKAATKKTEAEIVTRACRDVAFRAMQFTEKTTAAKITSDIKSKGDMLKRMAIKRLKEKGGISKAGLASAMSSATKRKRGSSFVKQWKMEVAEEMKRIINARKSKAAGLRAGWIPAVLDMGGKIRGTREKQNTSARKGFGKKATPTRLQAHIRNTIVGISHDGKITPAEKISVLTEALNKAIAFVASDRENYVRRKMMERTLKQYSDK